MQLDPDRRWYSSAADLATWLGRNERALLVAIVAVVAGVWVFAELADEVMEGETHALDRAVLLALRAPGDPADPLGPLWLEEIGRDLTALGGLAVLSLLTLAVAGYLVLLRKWRATLLVLGATGSGLALTLLLKDWFDRPRPDLVPHESHVYTASFPSGHSMLSALVYLTLGALLARVQPDLRLKAYLILVAAFLTLLVGVSRVYVGVHWPTDVLAGWTAGAVWALSWWSVAYWLQHRGALERR